jgi:hypothetical protein
LGQTIWEAYRSERKSRKEILRLFQNDLPDPDDALLTYLDLVERLG